MQQGVLFASIRNCDGEISQGPHKTIIRGIRSVVIKSARSSGSFNATQPDELQLSRVFDEFLEDFNHYPVHFITHMLHAAEVIGYSHPDEKISGIWLQFYVRGCHAMHMNIEAYDEFAKRLRDNEETKEKSNQRDIREYASSTRKCVF